MASADWTAQDPDPLLTRSYKAISEFGGRVLRLCIGLMETTFLS